MATAQNAATVPGSPIQHAFENFSAMPGRQKMALLAAVAAAIALVVGVLLWNQSSSYAVLFSNLEERDGGAIVTSLQAQNVPYKFTPGGGAIMVPSDRVHDIRLQLAAQGLPRGGMVGFELMENQKLGVSQFHEQMNYQRALEGELARTIQAIGSVANARVHLAIPKRSAFLRDQQKPTASVFVNLRAGRNLDGAKVAGIVHLVSSSVPNMSNESVSVIDETGKLLTDSNDPMRVAGLDPTQLRYVEDIESAYVRRIETIIEPMVGKGNFRAQVTADVDFNRVEQTDEVYKPNPSPQQAIRSQQSNEVLTRDPGAKGIPGALTNQPPVPATAPITNPAVGGAGAAADGNFLTRNASGTTNYEVDRTISHTTRATGAIRRLSVAVVLNHRTVTDKNGKETTTPLSDEEIARINNLVREAMGFNAERGDSLNVANTEFAAGITETLPELPLWKDPEIIDIGKQALRYLIVLAVLAYVAFGVIKPLLKTLTPPPAGDEEDATPGAAAGERTYDEEGEEVTLSESARQKNSYEAKLAQARETAKNNPKLVANMIKEWMGVNEEARK
ncbi:MAG: flagellar basal body M-ring protein FliF [Denitromonas halophila]|nr:MAG: flagellar basal body M-ring protein FliF [Denitromonas halophila]TVT68936.1 MAG: flagellar basal body M-ring protein FliF [Denitromonas halophila]